MISKEKLSQATEKYLEEEGYKPYIEQAFKDGAAWAQKEFIKSLWHDASEEPKEGDIVVQIISSINNMPYYEITQKSLIYEWEYIVKCNGIIKWCYVSDLLSKEGGEE